MKRDEAERVSVNHCLRDEELESAEALCREAEPGAWRVDPAGKIVRWGGEPTGPRSLPLQAASVSLVPRLLHGVRVLEEALRTAWAETAFWKREHSRERDAHEATARRGKARARADGGLLAIAELVKLSPGNPDRVADLLDRHAGGEDVAAHLAGELEWLRKHDQERREALAAARKTEVAIVMAARQILAEREPGKR